MKFKFLIIFAYAILFASAVTSCRILEGMSLTPKECSQMIENMGCIPSGEFIRGSDDHEKNERPSSKVFLDAFYMDKYEVTNADLRKCLNAGKCQDCIKTGICKKILPNYGKIYMGDRQPALGVSWYTAKEYCEFAEKRLPTEAEWEKAARGVDGRQFPWGDEPATCKNSVIEENGRKGCWDRILPKPHHMTTRDVGLYPPNQYGLYDMAGNSWEWVSDWYSPSYAACGKDCQGPNPQGACAGEKSCKKFGSEKIVKGGSWWWPSGYARSAYRRPHIPGNDTIYHHFGFRCAKDAKDSK
ncbi:MAG: formylglycine-generating enzyme family protein [Leptospira sp.]|nr:formylglycine-generating enzyme family protein [Leptospira sp.]